MSLFLVLILLRVVLLKFLKLFAHCFFALVRMAWLKWPLRLVVSRLELVVRAMAIVRVICAVIVVKATVSARFVSRGLIVGVYLVILLINGSGLGVGVKLKVRNRLSLRLFRVLVFLGRLLSDLWG
jgi:hypothetical protein